jgi:hypothetical protein
MGGSGGGVDLDRLLQHLGSALAVTPDEQKTSAQLVTRSSCPTHPPSAGRIVFACSDPLGEAIRHEADAGMR